VLYRRIWVATRVLARLLYRIEIVGGIPPGACIVAANHESVLDPPLLALVSPRPLRFLAKEELWSNRFGAWLMESLGAVPVARGREGYIAIDRAEQLIAAGQPVAIFPEGTVGGGAWTRGAARLALATGAPLVPARIVGTGRALSRGRLSFPRIRIVVGEPIPVERAKPTVTEARLLTEVLRARVEAL
jgi:1-acyl-sn-glycerol-3-phosphate acyltransferase